MPENPQLKTRGIQILSLLKKHGPLSSKTILQLLRPEIKERRLHDSLARLSKSGLLVKRHERVFRGAGVFYQINQSESKRLQLSRILACTPDQLRQHYFRSRELLHSDACARVTATLARIYPTVTLIQDFDFGRNEAAQEIIQGQALDPELRPDILAIFKSPGQSQVSIAFEIERSRKSKARLLHKLKKYANETMLDGVVYLCESDQVSEPVRRIYKGSVGTKSLRISHYTDHFFIFKNDTQINECGRTEVFNASSKPILLEAWVEKLANIKMTGRRDREFEVAAVTC